MEVNGISFVLVGDMYFASVDLGNAWTLEVAAALDEPDVFNADYEHKETGSTTTVLGDLGFFDAARLQRLVKIGRRLDDNGDIGEVYPRLK